MTRGCEWRYAPEAYAEDLGDLRKVSKLSFSVRRRRLTFGARRYQTSSLRRGPHVRSGVGDGRWKSQRRKIVYLSPHVEKPFNSKVIKSFVPELRSRKCFFCVSGFLCALWTFYIYITYSRMAMLRGGCPRGVMVKAMDCGIVVREFVLQSRYYVHFRANTLGKVWTPLSSQLWVK